MLRTLMGRQKTGAQFDREGRCVSSSLIPNTKTTAHRPLVCVFIAKTIPRNVANCSSDTFIKYKPTHHHLPHTLTIVKGSKLLPPHAAYVVWLMKNDNFLILHCPLMVHVQVLAHAILFLIQPLILEAFVLLSCTL